MSSRTRGKDAARARAAEMRAAQARAERRRRILLATGAIGAVIVIVGGLVLSKLISNGDDKGTTAAAPASGTLPASVLTDVTSVSAVTSDKVGAAGVTVVPSSIKAPALTADGKPHVLYVGAEYCPFCAAERWPMVVALSRFGTWSGLGAAESSKDDVFPSTPTLSFDGAKLTSDFISFSGVETQDSERAPLQPLTGDDKRTFDTYNRPPFVANGVGTIPFVDIAGKYTVSGASFDPGLLKGKTRAQIAKAIGDPSSDIGKAVLANANVLTAAICEATGDQPTAWCTSAGVKAGATALAAGQKK